MFVFFITFYSQFRLAYLSLFSAGVGRTGVFIALTNLIERVKTEGVVDVYQTVKKMRQQRTAMVQTRVSFYTISPFSSISSYFGLGN